MLKIRATLKELTVGEETSFPIENIKSVRTIASELGAIFCRQYTTKMDKEKRIVMVLRKA